MAKTIMVTNEVYDKLKKAKGERSFSTLITELMEPKKERKTIGGLRKFYGILKGDTEYDEIRKETKKRWKEWSKKYA